MGGRDLGSCSHEAQYARQNQKIKRRGGGESVQRQYTRHTLTGVSSKGRLYWRVCNSIGHAHDAVLKVLLFGGVVVACLVGRIVAAAVGFAEEGRRQTLSDAFGEHLLPVMQVVGRNCPVYDEDGNGKRYENDSSAFRLVWKEIALGCMLKWHL